MHEITRISVPVTVEERQALQALAQRDLRHPREQARWLLRQVLGLTDDAKSQDTAHCNRTDEDRGKQPQEA